MFMVYCYSCKRRIEQVHHALHGRPRSFGCVNGQAIFQMAANNLAYRFGIAQQQIIRQVPVHLAPDDAVGVLVDAYPGEQNLIWVSRIQRHHAAGMF